MKVEVRSLALAFTHVALAGWVDAVGFLHFARLFLSFMSGNTTTLAVEIGTGGSGSVAIPIVVIIAFVFGSLVGALISHAAGAWRFPAVLATVAALLGLSLVLSHTGGGLAAAVVPVAIAMGAQNAAPRRIGSVTVGLTYVTGTLINLGHSIADALLGRAGRWTWTIYAVLWLGMATGAVAGAFVYGWLGLDALAVPAAAFILLAFFSTAHLAYQRWKG